MALDASGSRGSRRPVPSSGERAQIEPETTLNDGPRPPGEKPNRARKQFTAIGRTLKDTAIERFANKAILLAAQLLGIAAGTHLSTFRGRDGGFADLKARLDRAEAIAAIAWRVVALLQARFQKVPERHRPHYSPAARFEILELRHLIAWNQARTAEQFLVATNTISNWDREQNPESRTVGSLAKPVPPVTRLNDVTRHLVQMMARFGFGGAEMISAHLALAGFKIAEKSVRNIKKERISPPLHAPAPPRPPNPVKASFVNHVWMMDVTEFKTIFGAKTLYLAACFDAFSRLPLAAMTFERKPGGAAMARLFCKAVGLFQAPRYLVTDLGGEFISRVFQKALSRAGVKPRFASADSIRATARLERFWKTLKQLAGTRLIPAIDIRDLEQRLSAAFVYYSCLRPHTSLGNRTPFQAFLGQAAADLQRLPRGRKGEAATPLPTRISVCAAGFPSLLPAAA